MLNKRSLILISGAVLTLALVLGFQMAQPQAHVSTPSAKETPSWQAVSQMGGQDAETQTAPQAERPFWEDAVVPDPGGPGEPAVAIVPKPALPILLRDYAAEVHQLENGGATQQLNDSLLLWFHQDPGAATEWINQTERFDDLVPSLGTLAEGIALQGQLETALAWVQAVPDEVSRHDMLLKIYANEVRQKRVNADTLKQTGFTQEDISKILGGSLDD